MIFCEHTVGLWEGLIREWKTGNQDGPGRIKTYLWPLVNTYRMNEHCEIERDPRDG